jgi:hypothetical protein
VLRRLQADATLSRNDRLSALVIAHRAGPAGAAAARPAARLPEPLLREVRDHVAAADREHHRRLRAPGGDHLRRLRAGPRRPVGRQRGAAQGQPGAQPLALLPDEPARQQRAQAGAHRRGAALVCPGLRQERRPATRLQWGAATCRRWWTWRRQTARIEATARQLFTEAGQDSGAFYKRSARSLERIGRGLLAWGGQDATRAASLQRLRGQLEAVCLKVDATDGRQASCRALLAAAAKPAA